MSRWTDNSFVSISPVGDGRWRVNEPLFWEIGYKGSGRTLIIPPGFITDLASIPRLPFVRWWLAPADQPQVQAAIGHDFLYSEPTKRPIGLGTKRAADREFRLMMEALDTPWLRRWVMWLVVRCAFWAGEDW